MTCQELREKFELYGLGVLEPEDRGEIDAHLARGCADCRLALAHALALNAGILKLVDREAPPKRLKRRIMHAIGVKYTGWSWVWALGGVLALAVAIWLGVQERQRTGELAEARRTLLTVSGGRDRLLAAVQFLADPDTVPALFGKEQTTAPRGHVLLHPRLGVLLAASQLPAAAPGKMYEMWVVLKGGTPRPAGLFQSEDARALHILAGPLDLAMVGSIAVTLEPAGGSAAPTTPAVISVPAAAAPAR